MTVMREFLIVLDCANDDELARLTASIVNLPNHEVAAVDGLSLTIRVAAHEITVP